MDTPYNQRPYRLNIHVENDEEVSENSSPIYYFDHLSSVTTESDAEILPDASPVSTYSNTEPRLPTGVSRTDRSFYSQSRNMRQASPPRLHHDYDQEPLPDRLFPQGNSFSERQHQQPPPLTTTGQHMGYMCNATEPTNQFLSRYENGRILSDFAPSPLSDTPGPSYEASIPYLSPYDVQDSHRSSNGYSEMPIPTVENWPLDFSPSYPIHNPLGMSTDLAGQRSPFSSRDEIPPASSLEDFRCGACNLPRPFENSNVFGLHYWDVHAPPAGSPGAWQPRKCIWDPCNLEKDFPTCKTWLEHAKTVHFRRFKCPWDGCGWPRLFGSQNSLNRHILTKHVPPENCKIPGCQGSKAKIGRKDKKSEHNAHFHGPLVCDVEGCPRGCIDGQDHGFSDQKELSKHIKNKHKHKYPSSQKLVN